jgi:Xaa-Pro aminopeptidase
MEIKTRIEQLRDWMRKRQIDAYIIPSADPHKSEYLPDHWKVREWISGFSGSAGTVLVTDDHAGLWTDSRYFLQAEQEFKNTPFALHKMDSQGQPDYLSWIATELFKGQCVAVDGMIWSYAEIKKIEKLCLTEGIILKTDLDPFPDIWDSREGLPEEPIFELQADIVGQTRVERIEAISALISERGADDFLVTALDEIAWLLNLRGRDVECNPVFLAWAIVGKGQVKLFVDKNKLSKELKEVLNSEQIEILPYSIIQDFLAQYDSEKTLLLDPNKTTFRLYESISGSKILFGDSPIMHTKALKNATEQRNLRKVMAKDGVALLKAYRWLEEELEHRAVPEHEFAEKIAYFRSLQPGYFGESFNAIIGYESNGAIVHYRPMPGTSALIGKNGMLLVDSGGQYLDGTTDITRTHHFGQPSPQQQRHYTLVLKGHIALANAVFPAGTRGVQLDTLARQFLWKEHLNYGHGTGHGVGFFMNVHEPPQGFIAGLGERGVTAQLPGMYSSNEPGFYAEGAYGIRIENLVLCQATEKSDSYYCLETITLFPIDTNLIDRAIFTQEEAAWLNDYHKHVYDTLSPLLNDTEIAWLENKCKPI